jgi:uncharacterized caspase-like protein
VVTEIGALLCAVDVFDIRSPVVVAPLAVRRTLTNLINNGQRHVTRVVLSLCEDRGDGGSM